MGGAVGVQTTDPFIKGKKAKNPKRKKEEKKKRKRKKERKQSKDQAPPTLYFVSALALKTQIQGGIKRYKFKVKDQVEISAETSCPLQD